MTDVPPKPPPSFLASIVQGVLNHFKPHRAEALQRIRLNTFSLLAIIILSNLLPLPAVQNAVRVVSSSKKPERWESDWLYRWLCIAEATCAVVFGFNILESLYAINYPRTQPQPAPSTSKSIFNPTTPTPKRAFKLLSPNSSPQLQKTFSMSQTGSFSASPSKYPASPHSTPSRVIHYPPVGSSTNTKASSTSTLLYSTPSPVVSAYRGKHSVNVGHALDGSFLGRLQQSEDIDDDESQSLAD